MKKYQKVILAIIFLIVNLFTLYFTIATFSLLSSIIFLTVLFSSVYLAFPYLKWNILIEGVGVIVGVFALILLLATLYHIINDINVHMDLNGWNVFQNLWNYLTKF